MAAWLPGHFGFAAYAVRFVHPAFGYVLGWAYFTKVGEAPTISQRSLFLICI